MLRPMGWVVQYQLRWYNTALLGYGAFIGLFFALISLRQVGDRSGTPTFGQVTHFSNAGRTLGALPGTAIGAQLSIDGTLSIRPAQWNRRLLEGRRPRRPLSDNPDRRSNSGGRDGRRPRRPL